LPRLIFLPLHALETTNAIRQRAFRRQHTAGPTQRRDIARERQTELGRIEKWLKRGWLVGAIADCEEGFHHAQTLSETHTERLGCRSFDLLHVAFARLLECDVFLTCDRVQGDLAQAAGLRTIVTSEG
jgi:hypothetical protein